MIEIHSSSPNVTQINDSYILRNIWKCKLKYNSAFYNGY